MKEFPNKVNIDELINAYILPINIYVNYALFSLLHIKQNQTYARLKEELKKYNKTDINIRARSFVPFFEIIKKIKLKKKF